MMVHALSLSSLLNLYKLKRMFVVQLRSEFVCSIGDVNSTIGRTLSSYYLALNKYADYYRKSIRCHDIQSVAHHSAGMKKKEKWITYSIRRYRLNEIHTFKSSIKPSSLAVRLY